MFDVSDRFLQQLAADRRASLHRSGRASAQRPLQRALRAGLARLGLASGGHAGGAGSLDRPRPALTSTEETRCLRDGSTGSMQDVGKAADTDGVAPIVGTSTARLRQGGQQA
jgi:hypothetical protein